MAQAYSIPQCMTDTLQELGYYPRQDMAGYIAEWLTWYSGDNDWYKEGYITPQDEWKTRYKYSIKPARRVAREWGSLIITDDTRISTDSETANEWLAQFLAEQNFFANAPAFIERSFALGTGAWALWFNVDNNENTHIKLRTYDARMIIPLTYDVEGVTECAFTTQVTIRGKNYNQLSLHVLDDDTGTYHIKTYIYKDGKPCDLEALGGIADFDTGINRKTFGIVRPAIENTLADFSPFGVSVFHDALDAIKATDAAFDALFQEVELCEVKVFMSDDLINVRDAKGRAVPIPAPAKSRLFRKTQTATASDMYEVFSPPIRSQALKDAFNVALGELGDLTGFGQNYFCLDKAGGLKTATEVSSDNSALMRNIRKHEHIIEQALCDVLTAALLCAEVHTGANFGDLGLMAVSFDDSIITDTQTEKAMALQEIAALQVPELLAAYLVKYHGMSEAQAQEAITEAESTEGGF